MDKIIIEFDDTEIEEYEFHQKRLYFDKRYRH